ncbi:MAG: WD40 repeat domain-containing protein [Thermodesulfobacteriota bacterium]|jgi:WD40 repeat protein|nr:MAG: WD40 repeat domain-containing protein [Thermodesulfobacteriota bacterium]
MKEKHGKSLFLLFTVALIPLFLLLAACSAQQVKMSPTMAVLNTSAFSPDGKVIAAGRNIFNVVLLYDASTARFQKALMGEADKPNDVIARSLSFSSDSRFLAAAGVDDIVVVWDLSSDQTKIRLTGLKGAVAVSFSPTQNVLAVSAPGNSVTLWKIPEGNQVGQLNGHSAPVLSIAFSPDGKMLATGGADKTARIWSVDALQQIRVFDGYEYPVHSVSFSPDGVRLATYSGSLKIWQWGNGDAASVTLPEASRSSVQTFAVLASLLLSARSMQLGGGPLGFPPFSAPGNVAQAISQRLPAIFSPGGKILALIRFNRSWHGDYEIVLLDMITNATKTVPCQCYSLSFSPDGTKLAVVGTFGISESVRLLDPVTGNWIQTDKER